AIACAKPKARVTTAKESQEKVPKGNASNFSAITMRRKNPRQKISSTSGTTTTSRRKRNPSVVQYCAGTAAKVSGLKPKRRAGKRKNCCGAIQRRKTRSATPTLKSGRRNG